MPIPHLLARRSVLLALPALAGCAAPLPPLTTTASSPQAGALLQASAAAHGLAALAGIADISVSYTGTWRPLVDAVQPDLVDAGYRGGSQERLLLRQGVVAQAHTGPAGRKQVLRQTAAGGPGAVRVWLDGLESQDPNRRTAAALVADGYSVFLLGPMLLAGRWARERSLVAELAAPERVTVGGQEHECDVVRLRLAPGLGLSPSDRLAAFIDRQAHLMRRVRFTLDGLEATRGAVAEVDCWGHVPLGGVQWPTRFHERLLRPLPLGVHDWHMDGLDVNRGLSLADVSAAAFSGRAVAPATALA